MNKENCVAIHSGSILTKEQTDMIYELGEKPIKIIFENFVEVNTNGNDIEIKRKLSSFEAEKLFIDIFGTTDIGMLDCSNMTDEEIDRIKDIEAELEWYKVKYHEMKMNVGT